MAVREYDISDYIYEDRGCEVAPKCIQCPLGRCRFEEPGGLFAKARRERDAEIVAQFTSGIPVAILADRFNLSERQIIRVVKPAKKERIKFGQLSFPWRIPAVSIVKPTYPRMHRKRETVVRLAFPWGELVA